MPLHEVDLWDRGLARVGASRIFPDLEAAKTLTAATAANPVVVTSVAHGYSTGDRLLIRGVVGMTELNGRVFQITLDSGTPLDKFALDDENGTGYAAYASAGKAYKLPATKIAKCCFDAWTDVRDEVLRAHPWNIAVKSTRLARLDSAKTVSSATNANPVVCTTSGVHGYSSGDVVFLEAFDEMVEVNDRHFSITVVLTTTFSLNSEDGTSYTAESTGGTSKKALTPFKADFGYGYRYPLPSDSLRVLELHDTKSSWVVEGSQLLTDDGNTVPIRYIKRIQDVTLYDPMLSSVMAARLAVELCEEITQSNTKREQAKEEYERLLVEAKRTDAQEQSPMPLEEDSWIESRL